MKVGLVAMRRIAQTVSFGLLHSNFVGTSALSRVCIPVMSCEACAIAWLGCPIGMIGRSLAFHEIPWLVLLMTVGVGLLVGRAFCGWVCPMGFLQDLLHKIPSRKFTLPRWTAGIKYAVLLASVFAVAWFIGVDSDYFYCNFCPTAGMQVALPIAIIDRDWYGITSRIPKSTLVVVVVIAAVFINRSFCKVMCPIGALVALTNRVTPFRIKLDSETCVGCRKCDKSCPMDVPVMAHRAAEAGAVNRDLECVECLDCQDACPVSAIHPHVLPQTRKEPSPNA